MGNKAMYPLFMIGIIDLFRSLNIPQRLFLRLFLYFIFLS